MNRGSVSASTRPVTRTLIVDDSVVFRSFIRRSLAEVDCVDVDVVGTASDGKMALDQIEKLKPELLTLDMNMPVMGGLELLKVLQQRLPEMKVIVVAGETADDAGRTMEALESGACDFIVKPKAFEKHAQESLAKRLCRRIRVAQSISRVLSDRAKVRQKTGGVVVKTSSSFRPDIVAIGASTGGPAALGQVIASLPATLALPVIIVQHMPKLFLQSMASRLNKESALECLIAEDGMKLKKGHVYLAPGEIHMEVVRRGTQLVVKLMDGPKLHHCKPAVDRTFYSLARLAPMVKTLAVVLTGMGVDGADGAKKIGVEKGYVIAQDEQSSSVWGMPGETVKMGAAHDVLPLDKIATAIMSLSGVKHAAF